MTGYELLVCPVSRVPLRPLPLAEAERLLGGRLDAGIGRGYRPVGPTPTVLVRDDRLGAYPVVDGIPVLMAPELLRPAGSGAVGADVTDPRYAEAYTEMEHYSAAAARDAQDVAASASASRVGRLAALVADGAAATFPDPRYGWLDATHELAAQAEAFGHLQPVAGSRILEIGGRGLHAVKFLLAGAAEAWLISPMVGELVYARALARHAGVADRLRCAAALAEELPLADGSVDGVYSQGCVHHWVTSLALPECHRVLRAGGRFAAVEPWRGPLYGLGTAVLGKRDPAVHCVVLSPGRVEPHLEGFASWRVVHHGALLRYPLLALRKAGVKFSRPMMWRLSRLDDAVSSLVPPLRRRGSSVAILATAGTRPSDLSHTIVGSATGG